MVDKYALYSGALIKIAGKGHIKGAYVSAADYEALEAKLAALVTAAEDLVSLSVAAMWQGEWDIDGELKDIKGALAAAKGTP